MVCYDGCTRQKIDHEPPGEEAVTKRENVLGQEWRRSRIEDKAALRRKSGVGLQGQNKKNVKDDNRGY